MAVQLIADLYGCGQILDDLEAIKESAHLAIEYVGANIVEECVHKFEPIGITYFAVISTSHFSISSHPSSSRESLIMSFISVIILSDSLRMV